MRMLKKFKSFISESISHDDLLDIQDIINDFVEDNDINKTNSPFEIYHGKPDTIWFESKKNSFERPYNENGVFIFHYNLEKCVNIKLVKNEKLEDFIKKLNDLVIRISNMGIKSNIERINVINGAGLYTRSCFTLQIEEDIINSFS